MDRLDRQSQPSGEMGSEYIYCSLMAGPWGRGQSSSDGRKLVLGWGRPSLQKSQLLPALGSQQALPSSGSLAPASSPENESMSPAPMWGLLGRQRAQGTVRTVVGFSSFCPNS